MHHKPDSAVITLPNNMASCIAHKHIVARAVLMQ